MRRKIILSLCAALGLGLASLAATVNATKSAEKQAVVTVSKQPVFIKEQMLLAALMQNLTITEEQYEKYKVEYAQIMKRVRARPKERQAETLARLLRSSNMMKELQALQQQEK
jgi:hypothetical protein